MNPSATPSSSFSSSIMQTIIVNTKTYDGGSISASDASSADDARKQFFHSNTNDEIQHHFDAFSYYSSQSNRMSMFYGPQQQESLNPNAEPTTNSRRRASTSSIETTNKAGPTCHTRRTRVSFEMHPSLLMMHSLFELNEGGIDEWWSLAGNFPREQQQQRSIEEYNISTTQFFCMYTYTWRFSSSTPKHQVCVYWWITVVRTFFLNSRYQCIQYHGHDNQYPHSSTICRTRKSGTVHNLM